MFIVMKLKFPASLIIYVNALLVNNGLFANGYRKSKQLTALSQVTCLLTNSLCFFGSCITLWPGLHRTSTSSSPVVQKSDKIGCPTTSLSRSSSFSVVLQGQGTRTIPSRDVRSSGTLVMTSYSDNIELSDGFIYASELLERTKSESKFDMVLDSLHAEIEIKCGRNIEEMKKAYKMTEDRPNLADKKKKRK